MSCNDNDSKYDDGVTMMMILVFSMKAPQSICCCIVIKLGFLCDKMVGVDSIAVSLFTISTFELIEAVQCAELYINGVQILHRHSGNFVPSPSKSKMVKRYK